MLRQQAVVLGESLLLRLPGCQSTCEGVMRNLIKGQREFEFVHTLQDRLAGEASIADYYDVSSP
jgi:hypothetical protein